MKLIENILYGENEEVNLLDIYIPDGKTSSVLVYFHGGGLVRGDKNSCAPFAPYLAEHGIATVGVRYHKYPDASFPDFIYDGAKAVAWAYDYMRKELDCDKLYVAGTSAGGYISMMLCFDRRYLNSVGLDNSVIAGYYHNAGQPTAHFKVLEYSGTDPRRVIIDERAPLYYIGMEKAYPRMRFVVSDNDMKNRYEETMLLLSALRTFEYTDFDHVVMHGTHCHYCGSGKNDENGVNIFGKMLYDFLKD